MVSHSPPPPWTYENGSVNPSLEPSNTYLRSTSSSKHRLNNSDAISSFPPYHPDYREGGDDYQYEHSSSEDEEVFVGKRQTIVRRGSEGYEVRPVSREEMLKRYLEGLGEELGRYQRYIPEPGSDSEEERGRKGSEADSENVPVTQALRSKSIG